MEETSNGIAIAEEEQKNEFQLSDIVAWALAHKMAFAVSVVACLVIGVLYAARTQPIYQSNASVMLRSNQSGQAQINEIAAFADLGLSSATIDVYNELQAFRSPTLMLDAVNRLGINVGYHSKNWIGRVIDWYDQTPVTAEFRALPQKVGEDDAELASLSFKVERGEDGGLTISEFFVNGLKSDDEKPIAATLGKAFQSPVGPIVLKATDYTEKNFSRPVTVSWTKPELAAKAFMGSLNADLADKNSTVINFSYSDPSPKRADDVLNALLEAYNEEWIRYTNKSTVNTAKFIDERLAVIEQELGSVDTDIERFKSSHQLIDMTAETAQVTEESSRYAEQAFIANNQLAVARFIREYLVDNTKAYELLPSNSGIGSQTIEEQIAEYNKKLLDRQRLAASSSDNNPLVADANDQLRMMRTSILRSIDNHISTLKIQADRLAAQEGVIQGRISSSPSKAKELLSIERQQKIKEQLYLYLLQKREENELQASIVVNNTRVLMPATNDGIPVSPKKTLIYAAALIIGLALPFGYMAIVNSLNTKVRSRKDLETLTAPILGDIPLDPKTRRRRLLPCIRGKKKDTTETPRVVVENHNRDMVNEAFRVMRTNLDFMIGKDKRPQIIMVTSYHPGSGKTFVTANMAATMALKKKRVAVVDLDIRKGTLSRLAGSPAEGVCGYLNNLCELSDIVVPAEKSGLGFDLIPAGKLAPNPAELLLSDRLEELADTLRGQYDYIFFDSTPMAIIADASLAARVADRTIFVIRCGVMDRRSLPEIEATYREGHYRNMALLLNGCVAAAGTYGSYGYGYGSYGYGND